MTENGEEMRED